MARRGGSGAAPARQAGRSPVARAARRSRPSRRRARAPVPTPASASRTPTAPWRCADIRDSAGPRANSADSSAGRPYSLTSVAPGAENRSVICVPIAALCSAASRSIVPSIAHPTRRPDEHGKQHQREQRDLPGQLSITTRVSVSVTRLLTTRQRVAEGSLRTDDVVVEAADQRTGAGTGEERDRHPLHVVEHRRAQIEDQSLADACRQTTVEDA